VSTSIRRIRYKYAAAAVAALALAGIILQPSPASATNWWVGSWNISSSGWCGSSGDACLFYSPNAQNGHWRGWNTSNLSGAVFSGSGYGVGAPVRNDAASVEDASDGCNVKVWVYPGWVGNSNGVGPLRGGNLNSALRNNEASIDFECP